MVPESSRIGPATPFSNPGIIPSGPLFWPSGSFAKCSASTAAATLPPDTELNVSILASSPSSFRRRKAPR